MDSDYGYVNYCFFGKLQKSADFAGDLNHFFTVTMTLIISSIDSLKSFES